jgi:hypothetical protein
MKQLLHLSVMAIFVAAFSTTSFAGNCGSCPGEKDGDKKDKEKTEQGSAS